MIHRFALSFLFLAVVGFRGPLSDTALATLLAISVGEALGTNFAFPRERYWRILLIVLEFLAGAGLLPVPFWAAPALMGGAVVLLVWHFTSRRFA